MRKVEREARNESLMCSGINPKHMEPAPYRFDCDDEFRTPPPFVRCNCNNGQIFTGGIGLEVRCPTCKNSPLPGWIPQWYSPEQYRDWIRRENDIPDYELPDDMPVWWLSPLREGWISELWRDCSYVKRQKALIAIATGSGRPPEDWNG